LREADALGLEVVLVFQVSVEVGSCSADSDLLHDLRPDDLVDFFDLSLGLGCGVFLESLLVFLLFGRKEAL